MGNELAEKIVRQAHIEYYRKHGFNSVGLLLRAIDKDKLVRGSMVTNCPRMIKAGKLCDYINEKSTISGIERFCLC